MNTQTIPRTASLSPLLPPYGTDAVILFGASSGGAVEYAMIAEELGYGPLIMPVPCDIQTIRTQLESLP